MNERQLKFCLAYAKNGNGLQAYKEAGYQVKNDETAKVNASRLLTNANVVAKLKELNAKTEKSTIADLKEIREFHTKILRGDDEEAELVHRQRAADLLTKMSGGYLEKIEHSGKIDVNDISLRLMGKK